MAKLFHWTSAAAFIAAYVVVYYVIWFMDDSAPEALPVLNVHWVLGVIVGLSVVPRLVWRLVNVQPDAPQASATEARLAHGAHGGLYALLIVMPLTGYIGTDAPTEMSLRSSGLRFRAWSQGSLRSRKRRSHPESRMASFRSQ